MGLRRFCTRIVISLLLLVTSAFGAAVTDSGLTSTGDTANGSSYVSNSFTPAVGDLLVVYVVAAGTVITTATMTDSAGLGFTQVNNALFGTSVSMVYCFVANRLVSVAAGTTVTFDCTGDAATGVLIMVARVSGMTKSGLSAIRQSAKQENISTAAAAAPAFAATTLTNSVTLGGVGNGVNPAALTPPTNWTERVDGGFATPTVGGEYVSRDSGFAGTTVTWGNNIGGATAGGAVIVELDTTTSGFFMY